jgi:hypothetical protein
MYATKKHRVLRNEREVNIRAAVCNQILGLEMDKEVLCRSSASCRAEEEKLKATMESSKFSTGNSHSAQMDPTLLSTLRSEAQDCLQTLTLVRKLSRDVPMRKVRDEIDCLRERNAALESETNRLKSLTKSKDNLLQLVATDRLSHLIISDVSCIKPVALGGSEMHLHLLNVSIHLQIRDHRVTAVSVTENDKMGGFDVVRHGIRAVHSTCLSHVTALNQLPQALQLTGAYLSKLKMAAEGVSAYARVRELEYLSSRSTSNAAEMTVRGQYYSSKKRCVFSVTLALIAIAPTWEANNRRGAVWHATEVNVLSTNAVLGECPGRENIVQAITANRVVTGDALHDSDRLNQELHPLSKALRNIWKLVE